MEAIKSHQSYSEMTFPTCKITTLNSEHRELQNSGKALVLVAGITGFGFPGRGPRVFLTLRSCLISQLLKTCSEGDLSIPLMVEPKSSLKWEEIEHINELPLLFSFFFGKVDAAGVRAPEELAGNE
ncbi:Dna Topoisomerase 1 [Manis pentadactyla]|nr:Dna Topoisomerase 1 [Manis pentadactyla]